LYYISGMHNVTHLNIMSNAITDAGLKYIHRMKSITHLDVFMSNNLTDWSPEHLKRIKRITHLNSEWPNTMKVGTFKM